MQNSITPAASAALPKVFARDGRVFTDSLSVAQTFDRQHKHVLRDIERLKSQIKEEGYEGRPKIGPSSFYKRCHYENAQGKEQPAYLISRDGFALLAFGFTGRAALRFKLKYIEAFNQMEEKLKAERQPQLPQAPSSEPPLPYGMLAITENKYRALLFFEDFFFGRIGRPKKLPEAYRARAKQEGFLEAYNMLADTLNKGRKMNTFIRVLTYRQKGLTQKEVAKLLDVSAGVVRGYEKRLAKVGFTFPLPTGSEQNPWQLEVC